MEDNVKEACLKELGYQILDQDEKVTAVQVANNWSVPLAEGISVLEKFAKNYQNEDLHLEYLIRGIAKKVHTITVVSQAKLKECEKKFENFSQSLFSVSKKFHSNGMINYKLEMPKVINIRLDVGQRPVQTYVIPEARPAMEKPKNKPLFAAVEKKVKAEPDKNKSPEKKKQETTPKKDLKTESPEKGRSSLKKSAEKQIKGKAVPKIQMGKGSIASFFGSKPTTSTTSTFDGKEKQIEEEMKLPTPRKDEKKVPGVKDVVKSNVERKSPIVDKVPTLSEDSSRKRTLSAGPETTSDKAKKVAEEPSTKKPKKELKTKKMDKRSRIMTICDSDSDEEEVRPPAKAAIIDNDEDEIPAKPNQNVKKDSPDENQNPAKKRFKATRKVTKSYQDEDGYIRTVREVEEYSCSEDEKDVKGKDQKQYNTISSTEETKPTPSSQKAKVPPKQGSIMSFFGKK